MGRKLCKENIRLLLVVFNNQIGYGSIDLVFLLRIRDANYCNCRLIFRLDILVVIYFSLTIVLYISFCTVLVHCGPTTRMGASFMDIFFLVL